MKIKIYLAALSAAFTFVIAAFLAVQEFQGQTRMNANQKANALGISNQCFYKTWRARIDDFNRLLMQWSHDADHAICRLIK